MVRSTEQLIVEKDELYENVRLLTLERDKLTAINNNLNLEINQKVENMNLSNEEILTMQQDLQKKGELIDELKIKVKYVYNS